MTRNDHFRNLHLWRQPDLVRTYLSSKLPASTPYLGEMLRREVPDDERFQPLARKLLICDSWASRTAKGNKIWFGYWSVERCGVPGRFRPESEVRGVY
jgi:hypothetical protein